MEFKAIFIQPKDKVLYIIHFGIPKYYLEIHSVLWTHGFCGTSSRLHLSEELFGGARLVGRRAHVTCHRINLSEVCLHEGVRPSRSFKAR